MLRIVTGNRQEILLDELAARLRVPATTNPLAPETLVCERGVDRWLWQQLAERHRIAANLDCVLPATFLWRTLRQLVSPRDTDSRDARDPFDGGLVRWRLMRLIPSLLAGDATGDFAPVARYLADDDDGRKLAQLATRVGSLFDSYLVYRPDMIAAWDKGRDVTTHVETERWQRRLWQALTADAGERHRVTLMQDFCADDDRGRVVVPASTPRRVSVFGLPALPPAYVDILARLARHIDIDLYVLSPSREFWGELLSPAAMAEVELQTGYAFDIDNRLLAANGQPVRHFLASLAGQTAVHEDAFAEPSGETLLGRLQADILDVTETRDIAIDCIDRSLQITSAYGPMREVEILHDALLSIFDNDRTLTPRDVLVMAPDMSLYAPLIDAVFDAADGTRRIPHTLADVPARGASPLLVAVEALLRLPQSRLTVNEVLALLETPAIAARWQFAAGDLDRVRSALREANVRWGLDGTSRAGEQLPDDDTHTWHFAFTRLFMGLAVDRDDALVLGVAPSPVFEGQAAELLGRLQDFVDALARWQRKLSATQPAAVWTEDIHALLEQFFRAENDGDDDALAMVAGAAIAFRDETEAAGYTGALTPAVFRDDFLARLEAVPAANGLLRGAVTCCRLQPMRSLPHRVICLLGMDAGAYPRRQPRSGFDLIELAPRAGDRARRIDDRHLFLETLLSARDCLYISYCGRSARDDSTREPSVLVGELIDAVVSMHGGHGLDAGRKMDGDKTVRECILDRLVTEHPLQPFSRRYFDGTNDALRSFDNEWLLAARGRAGGGTRRLAFCAEPLPGAEEAEPVLALSSLVRFFSHPGKVFLRERLDIHLDEDDETFDDDEPFTLDGLERWHIGEDWLSARIDGVDDGDWSALQRARGLLPAGVFGNAALDDARKSVDAVHAQLDGMLSGLHDRRIEVELDGCRIAGTVRRINNEGVVRWSTASIRGRRLLALWIEHLALCAEGFAARSTLVCSNGSRTLGPVTRDDARQLLAQLLALRRQGLGLPLRFFPETSLAFMTGKSPERDARTAWHGGMYSAAEAEDPAHRILFAHVEDIVDDEFRDLAQRIYGPLVASFATDATEEGA
ncbi:MAG: exodeoxyribonuclease V subunit gamma [Gammaproteobacteria bacterium]